MTSAAALGEINSAATGAADESVAAALKDIKMAIQATRVLQHQTRIPGPQPTVIGSRIPAPLPTPSNNMVTPGAVTTPADGTGPVPADPWVPRGPASIATNSVNVTTFTSESAAAAATATSGSVPPIASNGAVVPPPPVSSKKDDLPVAGAGTGDLDDDIEEDDDDIDDDDEDLDDDESESEIGEERVPTPKNLKEDEDLDTDQETDRLLGQQYNDDNGYYDSKVSQVTSLLHICSKTDKHIVDRLSLCITFIAFCSPRKK